MLPSTTSQPDADIWQDNISQLLAINVTPNATCQSMNSSTVILVSTSTLKLSSLQNCNCEPRYSSPCQIWSRRKKKHVSMAFFAKPCNIISSCPKAEANSRPCRVHRVDVCIWISLCISQNGLSAFPFALYSWCTLCVVTSIEMYLCNTITMRNRARDVNTFRLARISRWMSALSANFPVNWTLSHKTRSHQTQRMRIFHSARQ